jgi:peptidyl-tRNA hydrolase, PTH1 family
MKYLIAGLGNIGSEYELTRHNIGFLVADRLADQKGATWKTERLAMVTEVKTKGRTLHLIKPTTYMNLSGRAVAYWMQQFKIQKSNLLVITDDIALPFGKIRLRGQGSAGGHNGLKSIEESINGQDFARLRFGVGDNFHKGRQADYVLSPFSTEEFDGILEPMDKCVQAIESFCTLGLSQTMTQFNK